MVSVPERPFASASVRAQLLYFCAVLLLPRKGYAEQPHSRPEDPINGTLLIPCEPSDFPRLQLYGTVGLQGFHVGLHVTSRRLWPLGNAVALACDLVTNSPARDGSARLAWQPDGQQTTSRGYPEDEPGGPQA